MNFKKYFQYFGKQYGILGFDICFDSTIGGKYYVALEISLLFHLFIFKIPVKDSWFVKYRKPNFEGYCWGANFNYNYDDHHVYVRVQWKDRYNAYSLIKYEFESRTLPEHLLNYTFYHPIKGYDVTYKASLQKATYRNSLFKRLKRYHCYVDFISNAGSASIHIPMDYKSDSEQFAKEWIYKEVGKAYSNITEADLIRNIRSNKISKLF
jgi:hypothetical protein